VFDDAILVSFTGLAPLLALGERAGLSGLIAERVRIDPAGTKVKSAGVNPAGKLTSIIAGMACGADSVDDLDVIRSGGMKRLFTGVYAAATLGQFLREFTHGHTLQLASVLRAHLVNLVRHSGELISDAEIAETEFTAFASRGDKHVVTARLIVRRVRDRAKTDELFPVWRHHPFLTNNTEPTAQADITHRQHAIIETVFSDIIDGPLAHLPSGQFASNGAWSICAAITHNLLRAAGTLIGDRHALSRGATLRRRLIAVPARLARPQRRPVLHLPEHWPWKEERTRLWHSAADPPKAT
jgi:hypothetical protein